MRVETFDAARQANEIDELTPVLDESLSGTRY